MDRHRRSGLGKKRVNRALARDPLGTEGAILSEYAVVVGVCGLVISFSVLLMGTQLASAYYQNRQIVIAPVP